MLRVMSLMAFTLIVVTPSVADEKIDAKLLLGKWEVSSELLPPGSKAIMEFQKENKVHFELDFSGQQIKLDGKYKVEGNKLELTMKEPDGQEKTHKLTIAKLSEKEARLKNEDKNEEQVLKKIP